MKFDISDQLDMRYEALCLLERITAHSGEASGMYSDLDAYCGHYLGEYGLTEPEAAQIEALRDAGHRVAEKLTIPPEELAKYFVPLPEAELSLAGVLLIMHTMFVGAQPDDAALIKAILTLLEAESDTEDGNPGTFHELAAYVSALPYPAETKWACADLFLNYDRLHTRALELIDTAAVLLGREAAPLQAAASACADQLRAFEASGGLDAMFRAKGLTLDAVECSIIPCAMRFSAISLFSTDCIPDGHEHVFIRYGMLFDLLHNRAETQRGESDELLRYAKAFADKTRVQILFALKDAPLYAQDVVSLTGLSAATVSHHMGELGSVGFVALEKQGTRILYRLIPEKFERFVSLLKALTPKARP
jgi:DNA-binding transcriptional ArsR family regulator